RNTGFALTYSNAEDLTLTTGPRTTAPLTTVNVESTAAATPVSITTGSGHINVNVGKSRSVQAIRGDVTIFPTGTGLAALNVDASADLAGTVTVTNRDITGLTPAPAKIAYSQHRLSALTLSTGSALGTAFAGNTIIVKSTPLAPVTLNTGVDRDVV